MEHARAVEHDRGSEEEQGPLRPRDVPGPHGLHEPHAGGVVGGNERHVDDPDDEGGDGGDDALCAEHVRIARYLRTVCSEHVRRG